MTVIQIILFILAVFRLTRLVVFDKITEMMRRPFVRIEEIELDDGTIEEVVTPKGTGVRRWMGELLSCYWCTGIWISFFLYIFYVFSPILAEPILFILAMAGGAGIIQSILED